MINCIGIFLSLEDDRLTERERFAILAVIAAIEEVAVKFDIPVELITKLIVSVDENKHITRNNKLQKAFDQIINQNWLHYNSIERAFDNED